MKDWHKALLALGSLVALPVGGPLLAGPMIGAAAGGGKGAATGAKLGGLLSLAGLGAAGMAGAGGAGGAGALPGSAAIPGASQGGLMAMPSNAAGVGSLAGPTVTSSSSAGGGFLAPGMSKTIGDINQVNGLMQGVVKPLLSGPGAPPPTPRLGGASGLPPIGGYDPSRYGSLSIAPRKSGMSGHDDALQLLAQLLSQRRG